MKKINSIPARSSIRMLEAKSSVIYKHWTYTRVLDAALETFVIGTEGNIFSVLKTSFFCIRNCFTIHIFLFLLSVSLFQGQSLLVI